MYFFLFQSQGLSTYKELCSLASDLSQPDLVYKFMNLANHHAMWNSRKVSRYIVFFVSLILAGGQTQGLMHMWQVLYYWMMFPQLTLSF